ncbi:MAG: glycosyltransferase family 39 protein [Caldilineaceae bacterium]
MNETPAPPPPTESNAQSNAAFANNRQRLWLLGLILLAFALRVYRLDAQSLWYDEGVTAEITQRTLADLTSWTARDIQPPLYYYVIWLWGRLAGWSEWSLRFPSVFTGVLTAPLLAILAFKLSRIRRAGILAALIAALHPLLLYYSQEARMYSLLTMLGVLMGVGLLRGVGMEGRKGEGEKGGRGERGKGRALCWSLYVVSATAALYTHYFAFFLLVAFMLYVLFLFLSRGPIRNSPRHRVTLSPFPLSPLHPFSSTPPLLSSSTSPGSSSCSPSSPPTPAIGRAALSCGKRCATC